MNGLFLPTPSARRATEQVALVTFNHDISTHALREEGDHIGGAVVDILTISTHALREEGDLSSSSVSL